MLPLLAIPTEMQFSFLAFQVPGGLILYSEIYLQYIIYTYVW